MKRRHRDANVLFGSFAGLRRLICKVVILAPFCQRVKALFRICMKVVSSLSYSIAQISRTQYHFFNMKNFPRRLVDSGDNPGRFMSKYIVCVQGDIWLRRNWLIIDRALNCLLWGESLQSCVCVCVRASSSFFHRTAACVIIFSHHPERL